MNEVERFGTFFEMLGHELEDFQRGIVENPSEAVMASVDRLKPGEHAGGPELKLGIEFDEYALKVPVAPRFVAAACTLHVLLRHRLLRA